MDKWTKIIVISILLLMLLEPAVNATGSAQENITSGMSEYAGRHANPPLGEIKPGIPIPITQGCITAVDGSAKIPLGMVSGPSVSGVPLFPPIISGIPVSIPCRLIPIQPNISGLSEATTISTPISDPVYMKDTP